MKSAHYSTTIHYSVCGACFALFFASVADGRRFGFARAFHADDDVVPCALDDDVEDAEEKNLLWMNWRTRWRMRMRIPRRIVKKKRRAPQAEEAEEEEAGVERICIKGGNKKKKEAEEVEDTVEYEEFEKYYYLIEFFVFNSLISVCPRELRTLSTSAAPSTRR